MSLHGAKFRQVSMQKWDIYDE